MPAFTFSNTPSLELVRLGKNSHPSSVHGALPAEREINRILLLEIAPDREALLMSGKSIEEIRHELKIRTGPTQGHWLYRSQVRVNHKTRDSTTRASGFINNSRTKKGDANYASKVVRNENENITNITNPSSPTFSPVHSVRRSFSASSLYPLSSSGIENTLLQNARTWGRLMLSTEDKLISPRPLGPTHILVLHSSPSPTPTSNTQSTRRTIPGPTLDVPINDLIFVLNAPNLANPSALPHRLPSELPRVLLKVRHLQTFPPLVVYLHTKNQAELFRRILPEWIRDLMHPLPFVPSISTASASGDLKSRTTHALVKRKKSQVFRKGSKDNVGQVPPVPPLPSTSGPFSPSAERTIDSIGREIAEADAQLPQPDTPEGLTAASAALNALRDNMEDVGYYGRTVWQEMDISTEILKKAINYKAKLAGEVAKDSEE